MKNTHHSIKFIAAGLTCFAIFGCESPKEQPDPSTLSASQMMTKVETAYYEGAEKIETLGDKRHPETAANADFIAQILQKGEENLIKFNSRYKSGRVIYENYDVGVIPTSQGCPLGDQVVKINIDNEDRNTKTSRIAPSNWDYSWKVEDGGNTIMYFCRADGRLFNNSGGRFSVLKLGSMKPSNVRSVNYLHMDNEDSNGGTRFLATPSFTETQAASEAFPNYRDNNQNISLYWYVFNNAGNGAFPDLGYSYGVLGNPANTLDTGQYYTDDEDNGNANNMSTLEGVNDMSSRPTGYFTSDSWGGKYWVSNGNYNYAATGFAFEGGVNSANGTRFYLAKVK